MTKKIINYTILALVFFILISTTTIAINNNYKESENSFGDLNIGLKIIAEGFNSPIVLANPGDGTNRVFVCDQIGIIYIIEDDTLLEKPFLDISDKLVELSDVYDERGLLGMTFHPNYEDNGKFYVYYSAPKTGPGINHESILAQYTVTLDNPNVADLNSEYVIYRVNQPESNHNGGQIEFGLDGYLYIGLGDGGGAGDQHGIIGNGQNINISLGKILRIDVDGGNPYTIPSDNPFVGTDGLDEIYAFGFRNPWKFSFDKLNGELFVGDVGQDLWEEVNIVIKGGNYGWRIMEGTHFYDEDLLYYLGLTTEDLEMPIHDYSHDLGKSITGGYVYRKNTSSNLYNKYIFGDWSSDFIGPSGKLYYLEEIAPDTWERFNLLVRDSNNIDRFILSFGEDESGNLYVLSKTTLGPTGNTGDVRRIIPDNQHPSKPIIDGPKKGSIGINYKYTFVSSDPDGDVLFYYIDWGDGSTDEWFGPFNSGEEITKNHTWSEKGIYTIKVKVRDSNGLESLWGNFIISMPKIKQSPYYKIFHNILQLFSFSKLYLLIIN